MKEYELNPHTQAFIYNLIKNNNKVYKQTA